MKHKTTSEDYRQEIEDIRGRIEQLLFLASGITWSVETIDEKWSVEFMCKCGAFNQKTRCIELMRLKMWECKDWADTFADEIYGAYSRYRFKCALGSHALD